MEAGVLALQIHQQQYHIYQKHALAHQQEFFTAMASLEKIDQTIFTLSEDLRDGHFEKYLHVDPLFASSRSSYSQSTNSLHSTPSQSTSSSRLSLRVYDEESILSISMW